MLPPYSVLARRMGPGGAGSRRVKPEPDSKAPVPGKKASHCKQAMRHKLLGCAFAKD